MSCQWNGREMLWGLETKEQGALLIMVTVSELSKEDSPLCPGIASVLFFFQIHEVRRVTALFSLSSEARYSVTHLSPQGGAESDRDPGSPTKWVFYFSTPPPASPRGPQHAQKWQNNRMTYVTEIMFEINQIWRMKSVQWEEGCIGKI